MKEWNRKTIDAHVHVIEHFNGLGFHGEMRPIGNGRARWATGEEFTVLPDGQDDYSYDKIIALMDKNNIEKAVMMQGSYLGFCNDYVHEAQMKYPDRLYGMGTFDPYCGMADRLMHRFIEEFDFLGFKFEMSRDFGFMGYHPDFQMDSSLMIPVYEYVRKAGRRISFDMTTFGKPSMQADRLAGIAQRYPEIPFMVEHIFYPTNGDMDRLKRAVELLKPYENISFCVASIPNAIQREAYPYPTALSFIRAVRDIVGSKRLIWGTDSPTVLVNFSYPELKNYLIDDSMFTNEELNGVFYENAKRIYGI